MVTSSVTLLLAGAAYVTYDLITFRQAMSRDLVGHSVDPTSLAAFKQQLDSGTPRASVAATFVNSIEAQQVVVNSLFQQFLESLGFARIFADCRLP